MNVTAQCMAALAALAFVAAPAGGAVFSIAEPWVRPAAAGASTEAFMELLSSDGTTLVDVRSPYARQTKLVSGKQRQASPFALSLPAQATVMLAPGGVRVALEQLSRPLKLRDKVPLMLVLRHADGTTQEIPIDAEVRRRSPTDDHRVPHKHK